MVYAFTIQPGIYHAFEDEAEQIEQCKEWGLLSGKATKTKAFFIRETLERSLHHRRVHRQNDGCHRI